MREMALSFGIHPTYLEVKKNKMKIQKAAIQALVKSGVIELDDLVIYVGGRFGVDAGASFIEISWADRLFVKPKELE